MSRMSHLVQMLTVGEAVHVLGAQGPRDTPVPAPQFCYEAKTALKTNVFLKEKYSQIKCFIKRILRAWVLDTGMSVDTKSLNCPSFFPQSTFYS